jgi:hypothetical protein
MHYHELYSTVLIPNLGPLEWPAEAFHLRCIETNISWQTIMEIHLKMLVLNFGSCKIQCEINCQLQVTKKSYHSEHAHDYY